ncbi:MAG TPA: tRNA pseudouridine(55) synthase TruB [Pseudomonadota bacterium]|nr:tRNA pseudouridine(55) synthase TruB [Pseudomonadota bacterium]
MTPRSPLNDAVLVIDKPLYKTSFDVVAQVRRLTGQRRIGHAGTLDPLATGVLVLCLGEATKLVPYLMDADKEYRATARLGIATDTDDADPQACVLAAADASRLAAIDEMQVRQVLAGMVGWVQQRPPRFSALKIDGQRLYDKARKARSKPTESAPTDQTPPTDSIDQATAAKVRPVRIDEIVVEEFRPAALPSDRSGPVTPADALPEVVFRVRCGKGTYIRSLARDLGEALGVGAHLSSLRRLRVGAFDLQGAVAPEEVRHAVPHGLLSAVGHLPQLSLTDDQARRLGWGQPAVLRELQPALLHCLEPQLARGGEAGSLAVAALDPQGQLLALLTPILPPGSPDGQRPRSSAQLTGVAWQIARGFVQKTAVAAGAAPAPTDAEGEPCITGCA